MEDNYDNGKKEELMSRAKPLSKEAIQELSYNSIKRIQLFIERMDRWQREMGRSPLMYERINAA